MEDWKMALNAQSFTTLKILTDLKGQKEKYTNVICTMDDARGDFLFRPQYDTTPAAVITNKI